MRSPVNIVSTRVTSYCPWLWSNGEAGDRYVESRDGATDDAHSPLTDAHALISGVYQSISSFVDSTVDQRHLRMEG